MFKSKEDKCKHDWEYSSSGQVQVTIYTKDLPHLDRRHCLLCNRLEGSLVRLVSMGWERVSQEHWDKVSL